MYAEAADFSDMESGCVSVQVRKDCSNTFFSRIG